MTGIEVPRLGGEFLLERYAEYHRNACLLLATGNDLIR